jgi:hypothetical protein
MAIQCGYALIAAEDIDQALQSSIGKENFMRLMYSIHNFLTYTARISKFLWPSRIKDKTRKLIIENRGKTLRKNLSVDESSPLKSRAVRNYLDHMDSELDEWVDYLKEPAMGSEKR